MDAGMTILIYCVIGAVILFIIIKGFGGSSQPVAPREDKWRPRRIVDGHDYRDGMKETPVRQAPARGRPTTNEIMVQVSKDVKQIVGETNKALFDPNSKEHWGKYGFDPKHFVDTRSAGWDEVAPGVQVRDGGGQKTRGWH